MATDREEQQRQELEEIRRSFAEMGARMGSLFEPAAANGGGQPAEEPAAPEKPAPERPPWFRPVAVALVFLLGTGLGYILPRAGADDRVAAATTSPTAPPAQPALPAQPRTIVPRECLETAQKGDLTIHLLTTNVRDNRLVVALKDYTEASQACRKEASP